MNSPRAILRLMAGYTHANLQGALEYRTSLVSQTLGMLVNNVMWVVFWAAYYERFQLPGWTRADVIAVWACLATSVGLAHTVFGNGLRLAGMIERGELDVYLGLPKPVLFHVLIGKMMLVALGDLFFGIGAFAWFCAPGPAEWLIFAVTTLTGTIIVSAFVVIAGSLAFWLGRAQSIASQLYWALVSFGCYPPQIFGPRVKLLLYTVVPGALMGVVPVEILKTHRWTGLLELTGAAAIFAGLAFVVFHAGLRRYASGNLIALRE